MVISGQRPITVSRKYINETYMTTDLYIIVGRSRSLSQAQSQALVVSVSKTIKSAGFELWLLL